MIGEPYFYNEARFELFARTPDTFLAPMAKWFYLTDGHPTGPIEPAALKQLATSGRLKPTDNVGCEN